MTDLHDFEERLRADLLATATRTSPHPGAAERAIEQARTPAAGRGASLGAPRWLLPLAAAAVLLIAVSATVMSIKANRTTEPATPAHPTTTIATPTASVPTTPTTAAPTMPAKPSTSLAPPALQVVDGVHPARCTVADPAAFEKAFHGARTSVSVPEGTYDYAGEPILSVTSDGSVLAGPRSSPGRLDLISPSGSLTTLYRTTGVPLAAGESATVTAAQGDANWVAFAVSVGNGQASIEQLAVLDRSSGSVRVVRTLPSASSTIILPPVLFQGAMYWTEADGGTGSVFRYDPASGATATVGSGTELSPLTLIGGGLYWQQNGHVVAYRAGELPAGYELGTGKLVQPVTDGTTSIWAELTGSPPASRTELVLARPGMRRPVPIYETSVDGFVAPLAVTGPYVVWQDATSIVVLDTRTGATVTPIAVSTPGFTTAVAGGNVLALNDIGSKGGAQLLIAAANTLPELHC